MRNQYSNWLRGLIVTAGTLCVLSPLATAPGANAEPKRQPEAKSASQPEAKPTSTPPDKKAETIALTQIGKAIGGSYSVHVCKDHLLMESHSLSIAADAPTWNIVVLNLKTKKYFQSDYKSCLKLIATTRPPFGSLGDANALRWRKGKKEEIAGLSSDQWSSDIADKRDKSSAKYWTLPQNEFSPQCAEIMATSYGIPSIAHGIPLRFIYKGTGNSLQLMPSRQYDAEGARASETGLLDTTVAKKTSTAMTRFVIPKGLKRVKEYKDVALDGTVSTNADMQFIIKDLSKHPDALFNAR